MTGWKTRAAALVDQLAAAGELVDPAWQATMRDVPRHLFLPGHSLADAYADEAVVTQYRSATDLCGGDVPLPSSSASAPGAVAVMLDRLDVTDGMRVLEIGTGTGYNAALLCHRLGDTHVYSVDIDPALVSEAGRALEAAGHRPALAARDGYAGWAEEAPFDRIIATCAITHVPPAWIHQLTDSGRIVAPLSDEGALTIFDKTAPDEVTGRFDPYQVWFMPLRAQVDNPLAEGRPLAYAGPGMAHEGTTDLDPASIADAQPNLRLFLRLHLPGLRIGWTDGPQGRSVTLTTPHGTAHTALAPTEPGVWLTIQRGQRLWDTAEHALRRWTALDKPARTRYGISALDHVDRQYVWLDHPDSAHSWPLPDL